MEKRSNDLIHMPNSGKYSDKHLRLELNLKFRQLIIYRHEDVKDSADFLSAFGLSATIL